MPDKWTEKWTDNLTDKWTDQWTDEWTDKSAECVPLGPDPPRSGSESQKMEGSYARKPHKY